MENNLNIDWDLFCSNQNYHDTIKNHDKKYCHKYYDVIAQCPNPNTFVLVNMMSKLFAWTCGENYVQTIITNLASKFAPIVITTDLFFELLDRMQNYSFYKQGLEKASAGETLRRGLFMVNVLLEKCACEPLNINDFIQYVKSNYFIIYSEKPYGYLTTAQLVKSICTKIIQSNPALQINLDCIEYMLSNNLFVNWQPETQEQYRLLFKYQKKVNKNTKFPHDIECLENACTILNNEAVVSSLMKLVNPNPQCLSNALVHPNNRVIPILLAKVSPSVQQILLYCKAKDDNIMETLVTKYAEGLNGLN